MNNRSESYGLNHNFEQAVIALCCQDSRFYGMVGHALEEDGLQLESSKVALRACHAIAGDLGHGPTSALTVIQRLSRWRSDGKLTSDEIEGVNTLLDDAEDAGLPSAEDLVGELTPILKRRKRKAVVEEALDTFKDDADFSGLKDKIDRAERLGSVDTSVGVKIGTASFGDIERLSSLDRLPIGCMELDAVLDGGLQRKGQGVAIAGTGGGKSMLLAHIAASALWNTMHVAFATLELPEAVQLARIKANLTGIPINAIMQGSEDAKERIAQLEDRLGIGFVKEFTASATTVEDLKEWLKVCEDQASAPVDLLVVDYADKLSAPQEKHEYQAMKVVYEGLRVAAVERNMWCWTASQPTRGKDRKNIDTDDVADSMHKVRVADLVITINPRDDGEQLEWFVAKNRLGQSRVSVGPFPHDFACARIAPIMRDEPWSFDADEGWNY